MSKMWQDIGVKRIFLSVILVALVRPGMSFANPPADCDKAQDQHFKALKKLDAAKERFATAQAKHEAAKTSFVETAKEHAEAFNTNEKVKGGPADLQDLHSSVVKKTSAKFDADNKALISASGEERAALTAQEEAEAAAAKTKAIMDELSQLHGKNTEENS